MMRKFLPKRRIWTFLQKAFGSKVLLGQGSPSRMVAEQPPETGGDANDQETNVNMDADIAAAGPEIAVETSGGRTGEGAGTQEKAAFNHYQSGKTGSGSMWSRASDKLHDINIVEAQQLKRRSLFHPVPNPRPTASARSTIRGG